jgi:thiol-disulfide isomerase/thioredoxin
MKIKITVLIIIICIIGVNAAYSYDLEQNLINLYFQVFNENTGIIDFELESLNGDNKSLSSYNGKTVLLSFWATWCPPCREEMDSMQMLYEKYKSSGFEIIAVNLQESRSVVDTYIKERGYTFDVLLDPAGISWQTYGTNGIPTNYIIDSDGMILARTVGGRDWFSQDIIELIEQIINQ